MCSDPRRGRCDNRGLRILQVIHDFLPRHQAGSEIYAFDLCRELLSRHSVTVLCAEYDPTRGHGEVCWRTVNGLPVVEIVNNWICRTFADSYRPPLIAERVRQVLSAVRPHIIHVHSLLNLSFDLPAIARELHIPIVATLHDYSLVCASGGQRLHRDEEHLCEVIDTNRCVRCFKQSPFFAQMTFGRIADATRTSGVIGRTAVAVARRVPFLAARAAAAAPGLPVAVEEIDHRIEAARRVFDQFDLVVAPSPSIAREFERLGFNTARIRTLDYGFPAAPPAARRPVTEPLRIGFVGTLVWHKGVHVLLDAVRSLKRESYTLSIFGDTSTFPGYVASLRERAAGLPVAFKGRFARSEIGSVYSAMDVLVVPSIWLENSPLVIHEAFMAGVPVVGARIGGISDLVEDNVSGFLYEPRSSTELREILQRLIDWPAQLEALAARAPAVKSIATDAADWEAVYVALCPDAAGEPVA